MVSAAGSLIRGPEPRRTISPCRLPILVSILAMGLLACASQPREVWWKEDFSIDRFTEDSAWCMERAKIVGSSMPVRTFADGAAKRKRVKQFHHYCLKMKGYQPLDSDKGAPTRDAPESRHGTVEARAIRGADQRR